jgi:hypothetical protein
MFLDALEGQMLGLLDQIITRFLLGVVSDGQVKMMLWLTTLGLMDLGLTL